MHRRYNLAHFILASVIVLLLTLLMVCVEAQAQIAFMSKRDGHFNPEIYVMDADGGIYKDSLTIPMMIGLPHGHPTASALSFSLIGMGMLWVVSPLLKST